MKKMTWGMMMGVTLAMVGSVSMAAEGCAVPRVSGGTILFLNVTGIPCATGSTLATETLKLGYGKYPAGYTCKISVSGRNTTYDCNAAGGKHYDFRYGVS